MVQRSVRQISLGTVTALIATAGLMAASASSSLQSGAVRLDSARIVVNGTSNVHAWTAVTTAAKIARVQLAAAEGAGLLDVVDHPATLQALEIVVPAASLASPKER
jgi:hypothetical protein